MSSKEIRRILESFNNVDSLNIPKTEKFGLFGEIAKSPKVIESFEGFEDSYDDLMDKFEAHLQQATHLRKELADLLRHAARSNPENDGVDFKREQLEYHIKFWLEEFNQIKL